MQRLLVGLAVTLLIVAGVGAAIIVLSSRDGGSLETGGSGGGGCQPDGNVTITYAQRSDGVRIDRLAERLGAINTSAARDGGQAIIAERDPEITGVSAATSCGDTITVGAATDDQLEAFVREHLGQHGAGTP